MLFQEKPTIWTKARIVIKRPIRQYQITVSDITVDVVHKKIKNINLSVSSRDGRVRISAPVRVSGKTVQEFARSKLPWIRGRQAEYQDQIRLTQRQYISGEHHYLFGQAYVLELVERAGRYKVQLIDDSTLKLYVKPSADFQSRQKTMYGWYREQLKSRIPSLIQKWQPVMDVRVNEWRIKHMKTRWGSCNINAGRIWLNLELARKPSACLEYIVVHEMAHLLERRHNTRFRNLMEKFLPDWRMYEKELKLLP